MFFKEHGAVLKLETEGKILSITRYAQDYDAIALLFLQVFMAKARRLIHGIFYMSLVILYSIFFTTS